MNTLKTVSAAELMKDYVPLPHPENVPSLTLVQIISMEPSIAGILATLKPSRRNRKWFSQYIEAKSALSELVGWQAEQYALRACQAYDVVMDTVMGMLDGMKGGTK